MKWPDPLFGKLGGRHLGAFFFACLGSAAWMRLLVRHGLIPAGALLGSCLLAAGFTVAWLALVRWRRSAPARCAVVVGLCSGFAGAGLVMLLNATLLFWFQAGRPGLGHHL